MISRLLNQSGDVWRPIVRHPRVQLLAFRLIRLIWMPFMLEVRLLAGFAGVFGMAAIRKSSPVVRRAAILYLMIDGARPKMGLLPFRFDLPVLGFFRSTCDYRFQHSWVFYSKPEDQARTVLDLEGLVSVLGSEWESPLDSGDPVSWRLRLVSALPSRSQPINLPLIRRNENPVIGRTGADLILEMRNRDIEREVSAVSAPIGSMWAKLVFNLMAPPLRAVLAQRFYDPADTRHRRLAYSVSRIGKVSSGLRHGVLRKQLELAGALDPMVFFGIEKRTVLAYGHLRDQVPKIDALRSLLTKAGGEPVRAIVVIPHCRHSGAARVAAEVCRALVDRFGAESILLLQTDLSDFAVPQWFPKEMRRVDFHEATRDVAPLDARRLLVEFIRACSPEAVFNVNSGGFWRAYAAFGSQMGREMRIYSYFFCSDRNAEMREVGYPVTYFSEALLHHAGVFFDSRYLRDQMEERFRYSGWSGTAAVLYTPAGGKLSEPVGVCRDKARRTIFWCGRLDPQKRFDLVIEIARRMPECDFRVWGKRILGSDDYGRIPPNIRLEGVFSDLAELPLADFDLWLFTSAWEGIPTILLDLAAAELPLVSSYHTGLTDLLEADGAYLVESFDPEDYVAAIRAAFADTEEARRRAARLREKVAARHTRERFAENLLFASGFAAKGAQNASEEVGEDTHPVAPISQRKGTANPG